MVTFLFIFLVGSFYDLGLFMYSLCKTIIHNKVKIYHNIKHVIYFFVNESKISISFILIFKRKQDFYDSKLNLGRSTSLYCLNLVKIRFFFKITKTVYRIGIKLGWIKIWYTNKKKKKKHFVNFECRKSFSNEVIGNPF